jgi:hypothetical protein
LRRRCSQALSQAVIKPTAQTLKNTVKRQTNMRGAVRQASLMSAILDCSSALFARAEMRVQV